MLSCMIVDDEPLARQVIREYLQEHGEIERPLKPVIRFVAPIVSQGRSKGYLV